MAHIYWYRHCKSRRKEIGTTCQELQAMKSGVGTDNRLAKNCARLQHFPRIQRIRPQRYQTCSAKTLSTSASTDYAPNRLNQDDDQPYREATRCPTRPVEVTRPGGPRIKSIHKAATASASATGRNSHVRLLETWSSFTAFRREIFGLN